LPCGGGRRVSVNVPVDLREAAQTSRASAAVGVTCRQRRAGGVKRASVVRVCMTNEQCEACGAGRAQA
jgi:hypothetical protein